MDWRKFLTFGTTRSRTPQENSAKQIHDLLSRFKSRIEELKRFDPHGKTFFADVNAHLDTMDRLLRVRFYNISIGGVESREQLAIFIDRFLSEIKESIGRKIKLFDDSFIEDFNLVRSGEKPNKFNITKLDFMKKFNDLSPIIKDLKEILEALGNLIKVYRSIYLAGVSY